jgi:hypothetical protein
MSKTISVLLVLSAAVSFADIISLDLLPEDAEERALDLVEDWRERLYPDENIVIGDPVPLQAPDGIVRALSYPVGLNHEGTLTLDDCLQVSIRYREAKHAKKDYVRSLDSEGKELVYNQLDEKAEELKSIVHSIGDEWDQYRFITVAFSDDNPVIIGSNNLVEFGAKVQDVISDIGDSGQLTGYAFCPGPDVGFNLTIVGIYETITGDHFYRFLPGCELPIPFVESCIKEFPAKVELLKNFCVFRTDLLKY